MRRAVLIFLVFMMALIIPGCRHETDEDSVKAVITDIQTAAEAKQIKTMMENLSESYSDPQGYTYEGIHGLLVGYFFRYPKITVYINHLTISVRNNSAGAVFQTVLTSSERTGSVSDVIPRELGVWDFDVSLVKESKGWKVVSASWKQAEMMKTDE